jgi:predicted enzyme related to lactoylglutathione lyase
MRCEIHADDVDGMEVPKVGRLAYFTGTDGNVFGPLQPVSR